ncbi:MAG: hypothetical protein KDA91_14635 [Planctomycetaceae bacterium]|nr:hypothetical protein [Planctomycetaceae bacterium]
MPDDYERQFSRIHAPYMQSVTLVHCDDVFEARKNATSLQLRSNCANVDRIGEYKAIKRIYCELRTDWLKPLSKLPLLQHIQFTLPKTPAIPSLRILNGIRTLVLLCNRHQDSLTFLRGLKSLRSLCVSEAVQVSDLTPIGSLNNLQELYIDGSMSSSGKVRSFAPLAKLTDLRFAVLMVRSEEKTSPLRHLHKLKKLEYLSLAPQFARDEEELNSLLDSLPLLKKIEFNGGLTWPRTKRRG